MRRLSEERVDYQLNYKAHYVKLSTEVVTFLKTLLTRFS